jgi:hypothetical protein
VYRFSGRLMSSPTFAGNFAVHFISATDPKSLFTGSCIVKRALHCAGSRTYHIDEFFAMESSLLINAPGICLECIFSAPPGNNVCSMQAFALIYL